MGIVRAVRKGKTMKDDIRNGNGISLSENFASSAQRTVTIDVAKYQEYLDGSDLTPEQTEDFLRAVFSIVVRFVDLGFEVRPLEEFSGKDAKNRTQSPKAALDRVGSKERLNLGTSGNSGPMGGLEVE